MYQVPVPFLLAVCPRICAKHRPAFREAALYAEILLSLQELSVTRETWNELFSGALLIVVRAREAVSELALPNPAVLI